MLDQPSSTQTLNHQHLRVAPLALSFPLSPHIPSPLPACPCLCSCLTHSPSPHTPASLCLACFPAPPHIHAHTHIRTHTHTRAHTYVHTHVHTHTPCDRRWLQHDFRSVDRCSTPWLVVALHRPMYVVYPHKVSWHSLCLPPWHHALCHAFAPHHALCHAPLVTPPHAVATITLSATRSH